jgi:hypothetical protein
MGFDRPHLAMPPDPRGTSTGRFPTLRAAAFEPAAVSTAADGGEWSATVEGWDVLAKCVWLRRGQRAPARLGLAKGSVRCPPHESGPRRVRRRILRARRLHPGNTESSPPHSSTRSNIPPCASWASTVSLKVVLGRAELPNAIRAHLVAHLSRGFVRGTHEVSSEALTRFRQRHEVSSEALRRFRQRLSGGFVSGNQEVSSAALRAPESHLSVSGGASGSGSDKVREGLVNSAWAVHT